MTQTLRPTHVILLALLLLPPFGRAQGSKPSKDNPLTARNFLWDLYPDTRGKNYILTVEGWLHYDQENAQLDAFELYVGEGPQYEVKRPAGGCMGTPPPIQLPTPPELGLPSSARSQSTPSATAGPNPDCQPGPIRYKQALSVHFQFDPQGTLLEFHVLSPGVRQLDQRNKFTEFVLSHGDSTEAELVAALKNAGAKYGPNDKQQFIKDLPIQKLERFLGKLQATSVAFLPLRKDRANADMWPFWQVKAKAETDNGELIYELTFEQFQGELVSLHLDQPHSSATP